MKIGFIVPPWKTVSYQLFGNIKTWLWSIHYANWLGDGCATAHAETNCSTRPESGDTTSPSLTFVPRYSGMGITSVARSVLSAVYAVWKSSTQAAIPPASPPVSV